MILMYQKNKIMSNIETELFRNSNQQLKEKFLLPLNQIQLEIKENQRKTLSEMKKRKNRLTLKRDRHLQML